MWKWILFLGIALVGTATADPPCGPPSNGLYCDSLGIWNPTTRTIRLELPGGARGILPEPHGKYTNPRGLLKMDLAERLSASGPTRLRLELQGEMMGDWFPIQIWYIDIPQTLEIPPERPLTVALNHVLLCPTPLWGLVPVDQEVPIYYLPQSQMELLRQFHSFRLAWKNCGTWDIQGALILRRLVTPKG